MYYHKPIVKRYIVLICDHVVAQFSYFSQAVRFCLCWRPSFAYLDIYDNDQDKVVWHWIY